MKKQTLVYSAVLLAVAFLAACSGQNYKVASQAYNEMNYPKSAYYMKKYVESKPENADALRKLADAYRLTNKTRQAESTYSKLVRGKKTAAKATPEDVLHYAQMLMANEKYEDAREWFAKYNELTNNSDPSVSLWMESCDSIAMFKRDTALYTINEAGFRGSGDRFAAVPYLNGIVYAQEVADPKAKKGSYAVPGYLDLYYTEKDTVPDAEWTKPVKLMGKINTPAHEGPATFNAEGNICYFTRTSVIKAKDKSGAMLNISRMKIYSATKEDNNTWQNIKELPFNSNDFNTGHPALSIDGQDLYFMSDRSGGMGGTDLYVVHFDAENNSWSEPQNLGESVNSNGNEVFPFVDDNNTLYFSTDGRYTLGGLDVFSATWNGSSFDAAENLNVPVNSSHDDYCFVTKGSGETGFFSTNRTGRDRIFDWTRNDPVLFVEGQIMDKKSNKPIVGAKVELINNQNNSIISTTTDQEGKYSFDDVACRSNYDIRVSKGNQYIGSKDVLRTVKEAKRKGFVVNLGMEPVEVNKDIPLRNIYYAFNKWVLRKDAVKTLDSLAKKLRDNPQLDIEISAHTDSRGKAKYNMWLSERRAAAVVFYLRRKGVDKRRMVSRGYGESQPVNHCQDGVKCSEQEHAQNRRTNFKIINVRNKNQAPNHSVLMEIEKKNPVPSTAEHESVEKH